MKKNKTIRVVDLFSGCGGMSLGFQSAGFEIAAAYDNWQPAIDIYKKNFQHPIYQMDLSDLSVVDQLTQHKADVIVGGPPCQDFSIAGKRNFKGSRADLTYKFSEIIAEVRPKWFVMENVYNIEKSPVLNDVLNCFKSAGYGLTAGVYEASRMNVPQNRKRYFLIGKLDESDDFLKSSIEQSMAKNRMTVREYLGDMLQTDYYYMHPRSYNRRAIFSVDEPSATIRGVNRPIPSSYVPHAADKTINKDLVRALTTKERSYLQTFPPEYQLHGSKSNLEQLIGNAVPVKMAEFIALRILENF